MRIWVSFSSLRFGFRARRRSGFLGSAGAPPVSEVQVQSATAARRSAAMMRLMMPPSLRPGRRNACNPGARTVKYLMPAIFSGLATCEWLDGRSGRGHDRERVFCASAIAHRVGGGPMCCGTRRSGLASREHGIAPLRLLMMDEVGHQPVDVRGVN